MKSVAVFAGHYRQFYSYMEEMVLPKAKSVTMYSTAKAVVDGVRYMYVGDPDRCLRGLHDFTVVRYGTWYQRSQREIDLVEMFELMEKRNERPD